MLIRADALDKLGDVEAARQDARRAAELDTPVADLVNAVLPTAVDWKRLVVRRDPEARSDVAVAILGGRAAVLLGDAVHG